MFRLERDRPRRRKHACTFTHALACLHTLACIRLMALTHVNKLKHGFISWFITGRVSPSDENITRQLSDSYIKVVKNSL